MSMLLAPVLAFAGIVAVTQSAAAADDPVQRLTVSKIGAPSASPGDTVTYRVEVTNPSDDAVYNVSLLDLLPAGATYTGPTNVDRPYDFGDPDVYPELEWTGTGVPTDPYATQPTGATQLVWSDELDLAPGQSLKFEYTVTIDADVAPGTVLQNAVSAVGSTDPRVIPTFVEPTDPTSPDNPNGSFDPDTYDSTSTTGSQETIVSHVVLRKDKAKFTDIQPASGGGDWLRGVHEHVRTVPLAIDNGSDDDLTVDVVDYLPAAWELLGATDNSATGNGTNPEWTNGTDGTLSAPATTGAASPEPDLVETVTLAADEAAPGSPAGVYTKITWKDVTVLAGETRTITYQAGIPLNVNEEFAGTAPTPESGQQASNLDNNTGGSTRDLVGQTFTNYAEITEPGQDEAIVRDSQSYTIKDVVQGKTVVQNDGLPQSYSRIGGSPEYDFIPGTPVTFSLNTSLSEYIQIDQLGISDTLPDGFHPMLTVTQADNIKISDAVPAEPDVTNLTDIKPLVATVTVPGGSPVEVPVSYAAVERNPDGSYFLVFDLENTVNTGVGQSADALPRGASVEIQFTAWQQSYYTGNGDPADGGFTIPVVAGDPFTNYLGIGGNQSGDNEAGYVTTPGVDQEQSAGPSTPARDDRTDSVDLRAVLPEISKQVLPSADVRGFTDASSPDGTQTSAGTWAFGDEAPILNRGDLAWFRLTLSISDPTVQLRHLTLTDFLPQGTTLAQWRYGDTNTAGTDWAASAGAVTLPAGQDVRTSNVTSSVVWTSGSDYQDPTTLQRQLVVDVAVEVTNAPAAGSSPRDRSNLAKATVINRLGQIVSFRDEAPITVNPLPRTTTTKSVYQVNGSAPSGNPATVRGNDEVTYRVSVRNDGPQPIRNLALTDTLPSQLTAADVDPTAIVAALTVAGASDVTVNTATSPITVSWSYSSTVPVGDTVTFPLTITIPTAISVATTLTNTAVLDSFTYEVNWDDPDEVFTPGQTDTAQVRTPSVEVRKQVTSGLDQQNNNYSNAPGNALGSYGSSAQAVIGERVTFRATVTVPAQTTIYNGTLTDALSRTADPQVTLSPIITVTVADADGDPVGPTPNILFTEVTANGFVAGIGRATAADTSWSWYNDSTKAVVFTFEFSGVVSTYAGAQTSTQFTDTNTATFTSAGAGSQAGSAAVDIRQPAPSVTKTHTPAGTASPGDVIEYTLTASNGAGRPQLKLPVLTDVLPAGLTDVTVTEVRVGSTPLAPTDYTVVTPGSPTTDTDRTLTVSFPESQNLATGGNIVVTYEVTLPSTPVAGSVFRNDVTLAGVGLTPAEVQLQQGPDGTVNRAYTATDDDSVTVEGATITKGVSPSTAVIGQAVTYTIDATLPAGLDFYDLKITDAVPANVTFDVDEVTVTGPLTGTPTASGQNLTLDLGDVAYAATDRVVTITVPGYLNNTSNTSTTTSFSNTAHVTWNLVDGGAVPGTPDRDVASDPVDVTVQHPNVRIDKTVEGSPSTTANPGETFTYQVVVENISNVTAYNVVVGDVVPAGVAPSGPANVTYSGASGPATAVLTPDTPGGGTVELAIVALPAGSTATIEYTGELAPSPGVDTSPQDNTASVTSFKSLDNGDEYTYKDGQWPSGTHAYTDTARVTPLFPKITPVKTVTATGTTTGTVNPGETVSWTLTLTNEGDGVAKSVEPIDVLPAGWAYIDTTSVAITGPADDASGYTVDAVPTAPGASDSQRITWSGPDAGWTLLPGQVLTVQFTATAPASLAPGTFVNALGVSLTDNAGYPTNAVPATNGPDPVSGADTSYADPDAHASLTAGSADLVVTKAAQGDWTPGQAFSGPDATPGTGPSSAPSWLITVVNTGADTADAPFTIVDTAGLPTGVTQADPAQWVVVGPDGESGSISGSGTTVDPYQVFWSPASGPQQLADGDSFTVRIPVTVATYANGTAENAATVESVTYDPNDPQHGTDNNTDEAEKPLVPIADLGIAKTLPQDFEAKAGQAVTWTVTVTNHGPSTSYATPENPITVVDTLPGNLTADSVTAQWVGASAGDLAVTAGTVTGDITQDIPAGQSVTFTVTATIDPAATGSLVNSVRVDPELTPETTSDDPEDVDGEEPNDATSTTPIDSSTTLLAGKSLDSALVAGDTATYTLSVTNTGLANAVGVTLSDDLPDELTYVSWAAVSPASGWERDPSSTATDQLFALAAPLAPGATASVTLTVRVDADTLAPTEIENTVWADADNAEPDDATVPEDAAVLADLGVVKSHVAPVTAGEQVVYTIIVTNHGTSSIPAGKAITVTDTLPSGFTFASVAGTGWTTSAAVGATSVELAYSGGLAAGTNTSFTLTADVSPDVLGEGLVNTVVVDPAEDYPDPNPDNNTGRDPADVVSQADVTIVKSSATTSANAGESVTYTLTIENDGPSVARNVTVTDAVPAGFTITGWDSTDDAWSQSAVGTWSYDGVLAVDEPTVIEVTGTISPSYVVDTRDDVDQVTVDLVNTATVTWTDSRPEDHADESDWTVEVSQLADLSIVKTVNGVDEDTVVAGTELVYGFVVTNNGPSVTESTPEHRLTITDSLPEGQSFVAISGGAGDWELVFQDGQDLTFAYVGAAPVAPDADLPTLAITVALAADAWDADSSTTGVVNTAVVHPASPGSGDEDTATVIVDESADLSIVKTHDAAAVRIGDPLDFELVVTNAGPSDARDVTVVDTLPAGLTFESFDGSDGAWSLVGEPVALDGGGTLLTFALDGVLATGATAPALTIATTVTVEAYATVENVATVSAETPDPVEENNSSTDPVVVPPLAELHVTKAHEGTFQVGDVGTYVITVANSGPTEDPGPIVVTDVLPKGLTFADADQDVDVDGQTVVWTLDGALAVGESQTLTLTVAVGKDAGDTVTNTATVASPTEQADGAQLTDSDDVPIEPADQSAMPITGAGAGLLGLALLLLLGGTVVTWRSRTRRTGERV